MPNPDGLTFKYLLLFPCRCGKPIRQLREWKEKSSPVHFKTQPAEIVALRIQPIRSPAPPTYFHTWLTYRNHSRTSLIPPLPCHFDKIESASC